MTNINFFLFTFMWRWPNPSTGGLIKTFKLIYTSIGILCRYNSRFAIIFVSGKVQEQRLLYCEQNFQLCRAEGNFLELLGTRATSEK